MTVERTLWQMQQAWRDMLDERWTPAWFVIAAFLSTGLFSCAAPFHLMPYP